MTCTCKCGPGKFEKFEGKSALTALAYSSSCLGGADASGSGWEWFKAPFNFDADQENLRFTRDLGYCEECIAEALEDDAASLLLTEDSNGFVYLTRDAEIPEDEDEDSDE